jgi:hypothetical protein
VNLPRISALAVTAALSAALLSTPAIAVAATPQAPVQSVTTDTSPAQEDEDNRFALFVMLADKNTGEAVRAGIQKALSGTPADRVEFLKSGQHTARDEDNRFALFVMLADKNIGKNLKAGVIKALEGTPQDRIDFLATGQHVARALDQAAQG